MSTISLFEEKQVRRAWDTSEEKWLFAIVDVIAILTGSPNPQVYWRVMKKRLVDEGNETVTNCNALKMTAADGKQRMTDVADTEQLFRLIQSVPSPKAEPFKRWLADATLLAKELADFEQITADPAAAISRRRALTVTLRPRFAEVGRLLKKMDRLVLRFRRTEPGTAFASAWQASRTIRDLGATAGTEPEPVIPAA
jgi:hypothetical protein